MHIKLYGNPRFCLPLTTVDIDLLLKLSARHYDITCRQAGQDGAYPGQFGLLRRWQRSLAFYAQENEEVQEVIGEFRDLDLCLKIMEDPGPFSPEEAERLVTLRAAFQGALALANQVRPSWEAEYRSAPAPEPKTASNDPVHALRSALGEAYSIMDCKKALMFHEGDQAAAAQWLTDGGWLFGRMVSWDHASLREKTATLSTETGYTQAHCLNVLQNCAGHLDLARRKLKGLPVLG